jgi:hypothetical protein
MMDMAETLGRGPPQGAFGVVVLSQEMGKTTQY